MAVAPAGRISSPLLNLQTLVATSSTFQTWTGTASVSAARARCYMVGTRSATRPFCLINAGDNWETTARAGGAAGQYVDQGSLKLLFEAAISTQYHDDDPSAQFEFTNQVGDILDDMLALGQASGYLTVYSMPKTFGPQREEIKKKSSQGYFYQLGYEVFWGP